jgi:putative membrane protein
MNKLLATLDKDRIAEAVAEAETQTAGEIVPVIVARSDTYDASIWRGASALAVLALGLVLLFVQFYQGWGFGWVYTSWGVVLVTLVAGTLGAGLVAGIPALQRWLAGPDRLNRIVHHRAMRAFVEEEVFNTRDRTGILLFVSLLEHRIEVIGDTGINQKVDPDDWVEVVRRIRKGIKNDNLTEGMVDAIGMCGDLLERSGVEIRPDDTNELTDRVRTPGRDND